MRSLRLVAMVTASLLVGAQAKAQLAPQAAVKVQVVDSAGRPLSDADVSVVQGLAKVIAAGVTGTDGIRTLSIPPVGEFQVVVRRLGYLRGNQFFSAAPGSMALRVRLMSSPIALPTITVSAAVDLQRQSYHVDADDIAASERPILDAIDVLSKLRPDMMNARTPTIMENCHLQYVWVNGQRIAYSDANEDRLVIDKIHRMTAQGAAHNVTGAFRTTSSLSSGLATVSFNVLSVLSTIHPEHIAEMNYTDCNNYAVDKAKARNAVFVTLKPGVKFELDKGSFVVDAPLAIAGNRVRLIGVYDDLTGAPLPDVEIVDAATGTFIATSETGTATLAFLPDGAHTLRIRKRSYAEQSIDVVISAEEVAPITLTMTMAIRL